MAEYYLQHYGYVSSEPYLAHHGIKGQKWGVKHGPPYPLNTSDSKNIRQMKKSTVSANLDMWGKDKNHNTLFISGYSGSGKSTKANNIADKNNSQVIHLDIYLEKTENEAFEKHSNKQFNKWLKKNGFDHKKYLKTTESNDPDVRKQRWKMIDELADHIESYSKQLYPKHKLIVEGVQLLDDTIWPDKSYFNGKPFMIMTTPAIKSWLRARNRDGGGKLTVKDIQEYSHWYRFFYKKKTQLKNDLKLKHSDM